MATRDGAVNGCPQIVTVYGPDPRGLALFGGLSSMLQRGINGCTGLVYTGDRGANVKSWNGDLGRNLQRFTGAAALGAGIPTHVHTGEIASSYIAGGITDPRMRIFAARARRQANR